MTRITLTISDPKDASLIKKLLAKFDSVTFKVETTKRKSSYQCACDDIEAGRITHCESVDDMFSKLNK